MLEAIVAVLNPGSGIAAQSHVITRHSPREERRQLRILVAEDNKVNQLIAVRLLERRGHLVVVAGNGREAVTALDLEAERFDLVLMDMQMPEIDGFEAVGIIRKREQLSGIRVPIIALTAHAMKGDEERCLAAGMDGYISKPIHVEQLFAAIDRVMIAVTRPPERGLLTTHRTVNRF